MILNLQTPITKVIQPQITKTITTLTINHINDYPELKCVKCFIKELNSPITLWEGDEYDEIGQWTDTDVFAKLNQIYNQTTT